LIEGDMLISIVL